MFSWSPSIRSKEYCPSSAPRFRLLSLPERWLLRDFKCFEEPEYVLYPVERLYDFDLDFERDCFDFDLDFETDLDLDLECFFRCLLVLPLCAAEA